jgi:hypothetical protein
MNLPWIEVKEYQERESPAAPGFREFIWQALFACQVRILPFQEWLKLKWGFNASALFDETLERQRLFLETQFRKRLESGQEEPDHRTLTLRFVYRPGEGLLVSIVGKIHAHTREECLERAMAYYRELMSTFPYDYKLVPARTEEEFLRISGDDILGSDGHESAIAQIKRAELPVYPNRYAPTMQGLWRSGARAHEQIWRALGNSQSPLLLNISIRGTVLYPQERERLLKYDNEISNVSPNELVDEKALGTIKQWSKKYTERRLNPWAKFFYLQVHFVGACRLEDTFYRIAGTSLVLSQNGEFLPGYQVVFPRLGEDLAWRRKLRNLDVIFFGSYLPAPRLSEIADLDEVTAVMRLPYAPPEDGFPNLAFAEPRAEQE